MLVLGIATAFTELKGVMMKLNNDEVFALSDYLRHQLAIQVPMEQYFVDKAAQALEDLANERAELKAEIALLTTPIK